MPSDRDARHRCWLDDEDRSRSAAGPVAALADLSKSHAGRSAAATGGPCRNSGRFISSSIRDWSKAKDYQSLRFQIATSASMADNRRQRSRKSFARILDGRRRRRGRSAAPFWNTLRCRAFWRRKAPLSKYGRPRLTNHCMFTARTDLDPALERRFAEALYGMSYDKPEPPRRARCRRGSNAGYRRKLDGYESLRAASLRAGFFSNVRPQSRVAG